MISTAFNTEPSEDLKKKEKKRKKNEESRSWITRLWHFNWFTPIYIYWFVFGLLCLRKTSRAINSNKYVKEHQHQVSQAALESSPRFHHFLSVLDEMDKPPAILILNQYAINMTYNYLCNTADLSGVHDRLIFVTLDKVAADSLRRTWPHIKQFHWPTPALYDRFSFAEGPYQLVYLLRANLATLLIKHGRSFWMMQQDTFWRDNLFELDLESEGNYDMLFDQLADSEDSPRAEILNGANFYVRANNRTLQYFNRVAERLKHWYTADVAIMFHQCYTRKDNESRCEYLPFNVAHNWQWIYSEQKNPPYIIQLDCETNYGTKLDTLASYGFNFTMADRITCNPAAVKETRRRAITGSLDARVTKQSWGRFTFKVYYIITDWSFWLFPFVKPYMGLMAFCIMVTF
uniref:Nucleotide-diphospho-sugar transferase domain-containing protein n=1 Tax=Plectus sambesii TaxID=2011161 RepID=A0A914WQ83_9BILA